MLRSSPFLSSPPPPPSPRRHYRPTIAMSSAAYDRTREVREFDESKLGVKGLLDSGITTVPRFFHHHDLDLSTTSPSSIPTVDLSLPRHLLVPLLHSAARDWGFFYVTNHGLPQSSISSLLSSFRAFNELPNHLKSPHYCRETPYGVSFNTNFDLHRSAAATWRDTMQIRVSPSPPEWERVPEVCREQTRDWGERHAIDIGAKVLGLLSEALGLEEGALEGMTLLEGRTMVCHYYPPCPQPELTLGLGGHTDPGALTVLVQDDHVGGLQVKKLQGPDAGSWVDVDPVPGGIVINIGDLLQILSNDEYKSVEHRVVTNSKESRVAIAVFFNPGKKGDSDYYGPLPGILARGKPARFRQFTVPEFMRTFFSRYLGTRFMVDHFRV